MDHQEKLHFALGRGRRRASIGVHDLEKLAPPFRVVSVPASHGFVPLASEEAMSVSEILEQHPKGVDYAHLLEGMTAYPMILTATTTCCPSPHHQRRPHHRHPCNQGFLHRRNGLGRASMRSIVDVGLPAVGAARNRSLC